MRVGCLHTHWHRFENKGSSKRTAHEFAFHCSHDAGKPAEVPSQLTPRMKQKHWTGVQGKDSSWGASILSLTPICTDARGDRETLVAPVIYCAAEDNLLRRPLMAL